MKSADIESIIKEYRECAMTKIWETKVFKFLEDSN